MTRPQKSKRKTERNRSAAASGRRRVFRRRASRPSDNHRGEQRPARHAIRHAAPEHLGQPGQHRKVPCPLRQCPTRRRAGHCKLQQPLCPCGTVRQNGSADRSPRLQEAVQRTHFWRACCRFMRNSWFVGRVPASWGKSEWVRWPNVRSPAKGSISMAGPWLCGSVMELAPLAKRLHQTQPARPRSGRRALHTGSSIPPVGRSRTPAVVYGSAPGRNGLLGPGGRQLLRRRSIRRPCRRQALHPPRARGRRLGSVGPTCGGASTGLRPVRHPGRPAGGG